MGNFSIGLYNAVFQFPLFNFGICYGTGKGSLYFLPVFIGYLGKPEGMYRSGFIRIIAKNVLIAFASGNRICCYILIPYHFIGCLHSYFKSLVGNLKSLLLCSYF